MPAPSLLYACITHVPLWFEFPPFVTPIRLGNAQDSVAGGYALRDVAPEWEPHHPVIGGTAGTFALKALLRRMPDRPARVGICQYRKFVSRRRASRIPTAGYRVMNAVELEHVTPARLVEWLTPGDEPFLVCPPLAMRKLGYLGQYGRAHHAEDFLRFAAEAVEQGVLGSREAARFMAEPTFIPGGIELGVFPTDFWLDSVDALESVVRACIARYPIARSGAQARVWAFCAERLGSWLLLRHFRGGRRTEGLTWWLPTHWRRRYVGYMNLIVEGGDREYRPG